MQWITPDMFKYIPNDTSVRGISAKSGRAVIWSGWSGVRRLDVSRLLVVRETATRHPISLYQACRISDRDCARGDITCHNGACADHRIVSDVHTWEDDRAAPDPHV